MKASHRTLTRRIRLLVRQDLGFFALALKWLRRIRRSAQLWGRLALLLLIVACGGAWFASVDRGWMLGLLFITLLSMLRVQHATRTLYSYEAAGLAFFPIADDVIFHRVWIHRHRVSLFWAAAMFIWYALTVAGATGWNAERADWMAVPLAAIGHEMLLVALGAAWMAWLPRVRLDYRIHLPVVLALGVILIGGRSLAGPLAPSIEWLLLFIPTGWASGALMARESETSIPFAVYAIGVAAAVASFPWAYRKMRRDYAIREIEFYGTVFMRAVAIGEAEEPAAPDATGVLQPYTTRDAVAAEDRAQPGRSAACDLFVQYALGVCKRVPSAGRIEKIVFGRLTPRQRVIANLLLDGRQARSWGLQWQRAVKWLAILLAITTVMPFETWKWIAFVPVLLVTVYATPVLGGVWFGLNFSGASLTLTTLLVAYGEIARVVLFINRIRLLIWLPLVLAGCAIAGSQSGVGVGTGIVWGAKASYLAIVSQPLGLVMQMNERFNDRSGLLRALATVAATLALGGILVASAIALFQPGREWPLLGAIGLLIAARTILVLDRRRHERGPLDVVGKPDVPQYWG
jgi:hypothetical protein